MPFFIIISIAYILNSILYFYLPKQSVEINKGQKIILEYRNFNIKRLFTSKKVIEKKVVKIAKGYELLNNLKLNAIYYISINQGWIVVFDKKNNKEKTHILSIGDNYKGYKLIKLYQKYVIFKKDNKEYKLTMGDGKNLDYSIATKTTKYTPNDDKDIIVLDDKVSVQRSYLNSYINNFDKIWKDISILESKDDQGKINGFKVTSIIDKSPFKKLGLRKQDIIQSVNNIELNSYNAAFGIYKKINNIQDLNIRIKRNNQTMELNYEIK
jgi:general secretion pathway protein C